MSPVLPHLKEAEEVFEGQVRQPHRRSNPTVPVQEAAGGGGGGGGGVGGEQGVHQLLRLGSVHFGDGQEVAGGELLSWRGGEGRGRGYCCCGVGFLFHALLTSGSYGARGVHRTHTRMHRGQAVRGALPTPHLWRRLP